MSLLPFPREDRMKSGKAASSSRLSLRRFPQWGRYSVLGHLAAAVLPIGGVERSSAPTRPTSRRSFASSPAAKATHTVAAVDLTFPTTPSPSPFDIFHFSPKESLTRTQIKGRYLDLVKLYHPDRAIAAGEASGGKSKGEKGAEAKFVAIQAAYELLSDPKRRELYLRSGIGWGSTSGFGAAGGGSASPWSQSTAEYHFRRGRPMTSSTRTGAYAYDWASANETWTDPFNPHFRAHTAGGMASNNAAAGWGGEGAFGKNGAIFLALVGATLLITPLTAWATVPGEVVGPGGSNGEAWMPRVYDKRHNDAARNLQLAREEARRLGGEKREAIKRRVEQKRREQAYERALEVQAVERQAAGTGHLALPPPSTPAT
ncbi:hypothetical protein JCM10213v2_005681 [Rhodosporidiobolus nylandii]